MLQTLQQKSDDFCGNLYVSFCIYNNKKYSYLPQDSLVHFRECRASTLSGRFKEFLPLNLDCVRLIMHSRESIYVSDADDTIWEWEKQCSFSKLETQFLLFSCICLHSPLSESIDINSIRNPYSVRLPLSTNPLISTFFHDSFSWLPFFISAA